MKPRQCRVMIGMPHHHERKGAHDPYSPVCGVVCLRPSPILGVPVSMVNATASVVVGHKLPSDVPCTLDVITYTVEEHRRRRNGCNGKV